MSTRPPFQLALFAGLLLLLSVAARATTTVTIADYQVQPGSDVTIDVNVSCDNALDPFDLFLQFDSTHATYVNNSAAGVSARLPGWSVTQDSFSVTTNGTTTTLKFFVGGLGIGGSVNPGTGPLFRFGLHGVSEGSTGIAITHVYAVRSGTIFEDTYGTHDNGSVTVTNTPQAPGDVTFDPPGGLYSSSKSVTLTSTGASHIYYTTDDSTPNDTKTLYTGPFTVNAADGQSVTLKAIAYSGGLTSNATSAVYQFDKVAPSVTVSSTASSPTGTSPIPVSFQFNEPVRASEFQGAEVEVTNGTLSGLATSDDTLFTANATPAGDGTVTVHLPAGVCRDPAGNWNTASSIFSIVYDTGAPSVTVQTSSASPTATAPIPFTTTFSENVTGFVSGDVSVSNGAVSAFSGGPKAYSISVIPAGDGDVIVSVPADVALDAASRGNTAGGPVSVTYDTTPPNPPVVTGPASPTDDLRPQWTWGSGGGGGAGVYQYQMDGTDDLAWSAATGATSYTPDADLAPGDHTLYVRERDAAGNWSSSGSASVTIRWAVTVTLWPGWNLVAFPNTPVAEDVAVLLSLVAAGQGWAWDGTAYTPATVLAGQVGYWFLRHGDEVQVTVRGEVASAPPVLAQGWNLIGVSARTAVADVATQVFRPVWGWDAAAGRLVKLGSDGFLELGVGYWLCSPVADLPLPGP